MLYMRKKRLCKIKPLPGGYLVIVIELRKRKNVFNVKAIFL